MASNEEPERADNGSRTERVIRMASERAVFLKDQYGDGYASIPVGGHREVVKVHGKEFRRWLAELIWREEETALSGETLKSACNTLDAMGVYGGLKVNLRNRIAEEGGKIYYDLADERWRVVEVSAEGWKVLEEPKPFFRRLKHQQEQVEPEAGGSLDLLDALLNVEDDGDRLLIKVALVSYFVPEIPHPILVVHGSKGSAKTTLFKILRMLIDPSHLKVISFPKDKREFVQKLDHNYFAPFDNISGISTEASDILCRAVTGEGFSKRELYTDDDDFIYTFRRCVGLNGINVVATKPDLLDRCLLIKLPSVAKEKRLDERALWNEFERVRGRVLGAILDTLSKAMKGVDGLQLPELPRMADFAKWGEAISRAMGNADGAFLEAYGRNIDDQNVEAVHEHIIGQVMLEFIRDRGFWEGTSGELLESLAETAERIGVKTAGRGWPSAPHALSRRLNEIEPSLKELGIVIEHVRTSSRRLLRISVKSVKSVTVSEEGAAMAQADDGKDVHDNTVTDDFSEN